MVLHRCILVAHLVEPVSTLPTVLKHIPSVFAQLCLPVQRRNTVIEVGFISNCHELLRIERVGHLIYVLPTVIHVVTELYLARLTLFGRNQDNTISGTRTINSSRSSIFEHIDRLNICRVERIDVATGHTVNHIQRCRVAHGTDTANIHLETFAGQTVVGCNVDAGRLVL